MLPFLRMIYFKFCMAALSAILLLWLGMPAFAQQSIKVDEAYIFPFQEQHVHASSLVELPNGDWLVAWFQGSGERTADDVRIMGARKSAATDQWSAPFLLADSPQIPDCNPVIFLNKDNKLFLVWIAVLANKWEQSILKIRSTMDYEQEGPPVWQWQDNIFLKPNDDFQKQVAEAFEEMPPSGAGWAEYAQSYEDQIIQASADPAKRSIGWMTRIKPLLMEGQRMVLPLYSDGYNFSMMALSEDGGETWTPSSPLVGRGPIQPALAMRSDGSILALMRDSGDSPERIHQSISIDKGQSWSPSTKTAIPNTASVELLSYDDTHWFLLCNDITDGRYQLSLYLSKDQGVSWEDHLQVEYDPDHKDRYSYPSLIKGKDGKLHMTYSCHLAGGQKSIKYRVIDPQIQPRKDR